ncbi:pilus assembly protein PilM [Youngiibacter multivorans]|uniref:Uncharacterized protein n=1 Tax=Youngiibacter multivorans TaxID=937251 RepID=A0ABS4G826_9CLOT|nr:pilus assembly protein PilM [Youngiibacter multivorans]MBP1920567.1 hypothetical protein [Youngiibacter multivorans]
MKELIIRFSNESKEILLLRKGRTIEILDSQDITSPEDVRFFLERNSCNLKKVTAILDDENTVVKGVTTPVMKPRDIEGFVRTNASEYFALDHGDYSVDYRVISREKQNNEMTMILAAARRESIRGIRNFIELCSLKVEHIFTMQELMMNLGFAAKGKSAAIVRISSSKASIAIVRGNSLFLQASFEQEGSGESESIDFHSITENIMYYLNFYSKQNFGETVAMLEIIGDSDPAERVRASIELSYDGSILISEHSGKLKQKDVYLYGIQKESEVILGKQLDYAYPGSRCQSTPFCRTMLHRIAAMTMLTLLLQVGLLGMESILRSRLELKTAQVSSSEVIAAEAALAALKEKAAALEGKIMVIEYLKNEDYDLVGKLHLIQKSIPSTIGIDSIAIDRTGMDIEFRMREIQGSTLDAARLVLAINDTGVFEPLQLSFLEMDDSIETFRLELKYREATDGQ